VRLAQDFSMRYPLVDGQGNFGSVDGDSAAAMRYTEVRLAKISDMILSDLEKETVDFTPNYDTSLKEPVLFPTRIPNLLVNGASGIAVGMATNIPPHNLGEVIDALQSLIKKPESTIADLMKFVKGPDFPTAGYIFGRKGIRDAYETGKGTVYLRAKTEVEEGKNDKERIIVTELPYQVNKAKLIEGIADMVRDKRIEGISDIRDESDRKGMRIVFELKRGEDSRVVLNQLYKNSPLETSFGISMLALDRQQPKVLTLKECLSAFLSHRKDVVVRRTVYELKKAEEKAHILEALKKAVENLDAVVQLIRRAESPSVAQANLIKEFEFTEVQAKSILEMRLQRLTGLEREKIIADYNATIKMIAELKGILTNEQLVLDIISRELAEIRESFADDRRTQFIEEQDDITVEDLITDEEVVVTVTYSGYIKRLPVDTYRSQRRGGRGVIGAGTKAEDFIWEIFVASTHEYILCFTDKGRMYWLKVHKVPEGARIARGKPIINLLNLSSNERIQAVLPVKEFPADKYIILVTAKGVIKKTSLDLFSRPNKKGIIALNVDEGDFVVEARVTNGSQQVLLVTKQGQSIRFDEQDVRGMGRAARGVIGMKIDATDEIVGMAVVEDNKGEQILTVTEKGFGKRTPVEEYRVQSRGGSGIITMRITEKNGSVIAVRQVTNEDDIIIASDKGKVIRTRVNEISEVGRVAQGVHLISLEEGEAVVAVAKIIEKDEKEVAAATESTETT